MEPLHSSIPEDQAAMAHEDAAHEDTVHIVPLRVLLAVFIASSVLTDITVTARYINLGSLNIWIVLGIATDQGSLIVLYFMHLRYDSPFNAIVFVTAPVFMFLFLGITILDTSEYQPAIDEMMKQGR